jgi:hypothetical protein
MSDNQSHGRDFYYIENEGLKPFFNLRKKNEDKNLGFSDEPLIFKADSSMPEDLLFKFGRMFENDNGLIALGEAMLQKFDPETTKDISTTPAGYTFLGQFIDHDLTFDAMKDIGSGTLNLETLISKRSPAVDLDSLYGQLFFRDGTVNFDERLREDDGMHMRIGETDPVLIKGINIGFFNDLPREKGAKKAIIGDPRNDENLAVAQTHVAFLRFHNAVVDYLIKNFPALTQPQNIFLAARETVIRHYQWIILHDFLPRILDEDVFKQVMATVQNGGAGPDWLRPNKPAFLPVEFAGAAYRFGHSLLRDAYEWNRFFETPIPPDLPSVPPFLRREIATFEKLFEFTARGGLGDPAKTRLSGDWIIDWRRFYDFTYHGIKLHPKFNFSRKIDPFIAASMGTIPEFVNPNTGDTAPNRIPEELRKLTVRNLLRGRLLGLPTGQKVASILVRQEKVFPYQLMTDAEILSGEHEKILKYHGLDSETPLWYYILKEAAVKGGGNRLGPVGTYIVAATFIRLIQESAISILRDNWFPVLPASRYSPRGFEMADLLKFADSVEHPLINPLGDHPV